MSYSEPVAAATHQDALLQALAGSGDAGLVWLRQNLEALQQSAPEAVFAKLAGAHAGARRRLGEALLGALGPELSTACGPLDTRAWGRDAAGRACLLLAALSGGASHAELADALYRSGDEGERTAVVKSLCLLPNPAVALTTARVAARTNSMRLYAAVALDNPYPGQCYDDADFNQLVLKCLFNGLPLNRVIGLQRRANPRLAAMCEDYHDERVAAGRTVPADIWLALAPCASPRGLALACARLASELPEHRRFAAQALVARRDSPEVEAALAERVAEESDAEIRAILAGATRAASADA
ncbi:hypothetical protein CKO31_05265 [Thiohalocapsa halophila]|uniref:HEAT repeat domain-containing protein n=1 Tax=Thiohalocapsa halophila TaxID=69359 RepID=A0ABS1CE68_9GAMM|nr:EboA domain-containing protein [Thiohalocapsa halophila]MBK1630160.1 hypothetical protein [Thiohalocapsa halophila]